MGAIQDSISANGFYGAILAQASSGLIIAGEHRWQAAQAQGLTQVPVVLIDCDDDSAVKIMLADNRTTDLSGYDSDMLIRVLSAEDMALDGTGYTESDLATLLRVSQATDVPEWDLAEEWEGMPEFTSKDEKAHASVKIHFANKDDIKAFFVLLDRERSAEFWWPVHEQRTFTREPGPLDA